MATVTVNYMSNIKAQLSSLIQLATIDGDFAGEEKLHILMLGRANGLSEEEVKELVEHPVDIPPVSTMSDDERFEHLFNIVQLMKIDSEVYLSEIKYCKDVAEKLGFKTKVVSELASRVYSDPSISTDKEKLKKMVKKYQL